MSRMAAAAASDEAAADSGAWLHAALLELCADELDPDVVSSLVSYCESAPPSLAADYLHNVIGEEKCEAIVKEYLHMRRIDEPLGNKPIRKDGMQAYVKPRIGDSVNPGGRKLSKTPREKITKSEEKHSSDTVISPDVQSNAQSKGRSVGNRARKGTRGVSLAEAAEGKLFISRGIPCTCQATRHQLINNCLSCGRIVCEQEGEGPCNFCGSLVLREGSAYAGLDGTAVPMSEAEAVAQATKNRLVEYGRTSSQRTSVIDDQSDYFQVDQNPWLSKEEHQAILDKQEEIKLKEEARKKKVVVTIDITGQKVVMADDEDDKVDIKTTSSTGGMQLNQDTRKINSVRIKPNPSVPENPTFVKIQKSKDSHPEIKSKKSSRRQQNSFIPAASMKSGRIQHDDPIVSVHDSSGTQDTSNHANEFWQTPHPQKGSHTIIEDEECLMDYKEETSPAIVFDICEPQTGNQYQLSPSIFAMKQASQKLNGERYSKIEVLMPGMILLRSSLSEDEQVEIVHFCRDLGLGSGGFYQPGYGPESKMNLWMMCLGMHWEPTTHSYASKRSVDNSMPPSIPPLFLDLVARCLHEAQNAVGSVLPDMHPNICLVNFYGRGGTLGLHQDKDESKDSLRRGVPVVSFSIGDSAEFVYGRDRNCDENIVLESGDVVIFGGPSRLCYHGVRSILPQTAPSSLVKKTNLRPGRLNLTFRQS